MKSNANRHCTLSPHKADKCFEKQVKNHYIIWFPTKTALQQHVIENFGLTAKKERRNSKKLYFWLRLPWAACSGRRVDWMTLGWSSFLSFSVSSLLIFWIALINFVLYLWWAARTAKYEVNRILIHKIQYPIATMYSLTASEHTKLSWFSNPRAERRSAAYIHSVFGSLHALYENPWAHICTFFANLAKFIFISGIE